MKKTIRMLFLWACCLAFSCVKGQDDVPSSLVKKRGEWNDLWIFKTIILNDSNSGSIHAWFMREGVDYWIECRSDPDPITDKMTITLAVGKTFNFGKKTLTESKFHITPKAGVASTKDDNPITLECNIGGRFGNFNYFNLLQIVPGKGNQVRDIHFVQDYFKCGYKPKKWFQINFFAQIHIFNNHDYVLYQGGQVLFFKENFSFGVWLSNDIKNCRNQGTIQLGIKF